MLIKTPTMYEFYQQLLSPAPDKKNELMFSVVLIDDDQLFREQMKDYLHSMNVSDVKTYSSGEDFLKTLNDDDKKFVVCDFDFGSTNLMNGLQVLEEIKKRNPGTPVIILSSQDKIQIALETLQKGAVDYFIKGMENTFTSVLTSILKINELQRLRKSEKDYIRTLIVGSIISVAVIAFLMYNLYK